jgi:ZIP family zinc transporter
MKTQSSSTTTDPSRSNGTAWVLFATTLALLGVLLIYVLMQRDKATEAVEVEAEQLTIEQILLPEPGVIQVEVVNHGPEEITIPQVLVDDAYWDFKADPSNTIPALAKATVTLPYPWVAEELHSILLITSRGEIFEGEVVASEEPSSSGASQ